MDHIIVIGGGIIGLMTARELSIAGARVSLIERQELARESSWAGGGIVSPLYPWRYLDSITALARWGQTAYPPLVEVLKSDTGIDAEYEPNGMLMISPEEQPEALAWAERHDRRAEIVAPQKLAELEPARAPVDQEAIWMPEVGQVRNPRLVKALIADLGRRGVEIRTRQAATPSLGPNGELAGVGLDDRVVKADAVVVCAGAWSHDVLADLPHPPDVRPVRGQMILFRTEPGVIRRIVLEQSRYIIPRRDGRVLFGSTLEEAGFDKSTTEAARAELTGLAIERFPVLADYPIEHHWAGLRPGSPAGVPYIAAHPEIARLFVCAGHYRNGVVLGPASARLVSDLIRGREPILPPDPYSLTAPRG